MLFVSGQIGIDPDTKRFVGSDITAQTRRVLDNLRNILEAGGCGLENVIKVNVYMCDMGEFDAFNKVYVTYFEPPRPARTTVQVAGLAGPYTLEVDAIALVPERPRNEARA